MAYSYRLAHATHILVNICLAEGEGRCVSSASIAQSLAANPSQVRQIMCRLRRAGLIRTSQGSSRSVLARPAGDITMLDIYRAVEGDGSLLHLGTHVNPECGVGQEVQRIIGRRYDEIQRAAESAMGGVTLAGIVDEYRSGLGEGAR